MMAAGPRTARLGVVNCPRLPTLSAGTDGSCRRGAAGSQKSVGGEKFWQRRYFYHSKSNMLQEIECFSRIHHQASPKVSVIFRNSSIKKDHTTVTETRRKYLKSLSNLNFEVNWRLRGDWRIHAQA